MASNISAEQVDQQISTVLEQLKQRDPHQKEFHQAVAEVFSSLRSLFLQSPHYLSVLPRLVEPDRLIHFRVTWVDDQGKEQVNRGFRVQFSNAIGPYKGGLRFHPTVNASIIKFLGFEQVFKNALTTLPMGGGKGGSDFDPKGKSDREVMAFCQSFMLELAKYIGPNIDVPAGDIGVGAREIGYLFGQYKRMTTEWTGVLTGKGLSYGGSLIRPEATGYGLLYFVDNLVRDCWGEGVEGKKVLISGSGNVAQFACEKALEMGAKVLTMSDSSGYILEKDGFTSQQLEHIKELKNKKRGRIHEYTSFSSSAVFFPKERPWGVPCDIALPCATQNEINLEDAEKLVKGGCKLLAEGANMPSTNEAISHVMKNGALFGPAKAANAGGVAVSGLEMSQNSGRVGWSKEEVDERLKGIMKRVYEQAKEEAEGLGEPRNFQLGANVAGFKKVAEALLAQGSV